MLSDSSTGRRWFETAVQAFVIYSIGSYIVESELTEEGYIRQGHPFFLWSERFFGVCFALEYLFRWANSKNRLRYPFTILAVIDLMAILPFFAALAVDMRPLKLIRALRFLRLFKLYRYNAALQKVMHGFRKVKDELAVVGFVVIIVVMFSSFAIHEFEQEAQPEKFKRLSDAVWWSFATLTTVGYGDLAPVTLGGRIIAVLTMSIGIGIFGTFISLIGSSFLATMREEHWEDESTAVELATKLAVEHEEEPDDAPWIEATLERNNRAA